MRRNDLEALNKKTNCIDCGQKGHWKGDKKCPKAKDHRAAVEKAINMIAAYLEGWEESHGCEQCVMQTTQTVTVETQNGYNLETCSWNCMFMSFDSTIIFDGEDDSLEAVCFMVTASQDESM